MNYLAYLKWILVLIVISVGVIFLLNGLGVNIPFIKFKEFESLQLPAGAFLLICGVVMAIFWKVKISEIKTTETTETLGGGGSDDNASDVFEKKIKTVEEKHGTFIKP